MNWYRQVTFEPNVHSQPVFSIVEGVGVAKLRCLMLMPPVADGLGELPRMDMLRTPARSVLVPEDALGDDMRVFEALPLMLMAPAFGRSTAGGGWEANAGSYGRRPGSSYRGRNSCCAHPVSVAPTRWGVHPYSPALTSHSSRGIAHSSPPFSDTQARLPCLQRPRECSSSSRRQSVCRWLQVVLDFWHFAIDLQAEGRNEQQRDRLARLLRRQCVRSHPTKEPADADMLLSPPFQHPALSSFPSHLQRLKHHSAWGPVLLAAIEAAREAGRSTRCGQYLVLTAH